MIRYLPLLLALLASTALGLEPTAYTGRIVREITVDAPRGVDTDQLAYLVDQPEGEPLNPQAVSRSLELLFRLGQFDSVEAAVVPLPDGSVELVFHLAPSPRIGRLQLRGVRTQPPSAVRAALERGRGDRYVEGDESRLAQQAERFYRSRGYLDVIATGRVATTPLGNKAVRIEVEEGERYRIGAIRFLGGRTGYSEEDLLRFLSREVRPGGWYREDALQDGLQLLLTKLRRRRVVDSSDPDARRGFVEARLVTLDGPRRRSRIPVEVRKDSEARTVDVVVPLDAGTLVETRFAFAGQRPGGWWSTPRLERVIGLESAARVSRTYAEDAARQLEKFLWSRGYYHAKVEVAVVDEALLPTAHQPPGAPTPEVERVRTLRFVADPGPRVTLRSRDITFEGFSYKRSVGLGVLSDGSPDVIGHRPWIFQVLGLDVYERYFTDGQLDQAMDVFRAWYRAKGYLSATLTPTARIVEGTCADGVESEEGHRACLSIAVDEGVQTRVESVRIELGGAELDPDRVEAWRESLEGQPFNPSQLDALTLDIADALAEQGFIDAEVEAAREVSTDGTLARIDVVADPGTQVRFGKLVVRESRHTQVGFIRQRIPVEPGQIFDRSELQEAQARLLRTGLFDGVVLEAAQLSGRVRDVDVLVNERKRFSFVFGAGVTWPDDGPRVSGEGRLRNLDGYGFSLWARGRASIDWRSIVLGFVLPEYRASLGLEFPYLPGSQVRGVLTGLINEELDEPTYRISRSGATLGVNAQPTERLTFDGQLEVQLRAPIRVDESARLNALTDVPVDQPRLHPKVLLVGTLSVVVDQRDDPFNPTRGLYLAGTVDSTAGPLIPDSPAFGRASARVVGLVPFGDSGVGLQVEASGGIAWSYDGMLPPVEWRYRLGGTSTVRGYRLDSIGPSGTRPGTLESLNLLGASPEREVPVGGNAFHRYSVQLQVPVIGFTGWRLSFFGDFGNALIYGTTPDGVDNGRKPFLHVGTGVGLRRTTPIGPLRLDVAVRPDSLAELVQGGRPALADVLQIHFAVGAL